MNKKRLIVPQFGFCFLPFLIGLIVSLILLSIPKLNPVIRFQGRIDLSVLIVLIGVILTLILLSLWINKKQNSQKMASSIRRAKEETEQTHRRFIKRLDHELKNPVTALHVQLDYLLGQENHSCNDQVINDMNAQLEHLDSLITGLRQLAELEEKQIDFVPVDIEKLLHEVVEIAQTNPLYSDRRIKLTILQVPWKFKSVRGDYALLSLAIYNLLDNALKFTDSEDSVELRAFQVFPWLIIETIDTGSGVAKEDLPFIFEELYRGENARGYAGNGIGLATVKAIIDHHAGNISVESHPQQGTVFSIRLPLNADY